MNLHERRRAVVLVQHVDRLRDGGRGVLEVLRRLQVLLVLLLTDLRNERFKEKPFGLFTHSPLRLFIFGLAFEADFRESV